jgi:hypothetical protein
VEPEAIGQVPPGRGAERVTLTERIALRGFDLFARLGAWDAPRSSWRWRGYLWCLARTPMARWSGRLK